ncbi:hypothetical protein GCM10010885_01040 [Alicyclobacillus cellulosilyticus]|uniref:Regulatory protein YycH-like domain-containing protein n=1 Tax=Alicyclobacillus cellulosilyticus TaxID=1003997 RepID=A0A917K1R8_9BACL|nr:two-component system regulatory protein YycI [Alicyclobacillus cellulosilyticus]GGI95230.1 hypothetical protein GCM10010885_01040 [Alicyclobacillus cellulosilyticus]
MNWEQAKTWFIFAFLLLDLVLAWPLYTDRIQTAGYAESYQDQLANTKTLLAEHGLTLAANVPTDHPSLSTLHADFANPPLRELARAAFHSPRIEEFVGGAQGSDGRVMLIGSGSWQVEYDRPIAAKGAAAWLNRVWHGSEYMADTALAQRFAPTYEQAYDDYPMFDVTLTFDVRGGILHGYMQTCVVNITPAGSAKPTVSALDALDSLATMVDNGSGHSAARIVDIQLGYVRKVAVNPDGASQPANYWFPVWRVVTTRQVYYINALTGEVDSPY